VDFVIMFVPNEAPHQLAITSDHNLWQDAFQRKVLIVSPVNLMALLQLIHLAWVRDDQEKNQKKIMEEGERLLKRLYSFYDHISKLGKSLDDASKSYQDAVNKLKDGNQSVVKTGKNLLKLGLRMNKEAKEPTCLQSEENEEEISSTDEEITESEQTSNSLTEKEIN